MMYYFSISDDADTHLGFLVMTADDEGEMLPTSGQFAIKLVADRMYSVLAKLQDYSGALYWVAEKDGVNLLDTEQRVLGMIRQQWLIFEGKRFVLTDLTGTL